MELKTIQHKQTKPSLPFPLRLNMKVPFLHLPGQGLASNQGKDLSLEAYDNHHCQLCFSAHKQGVIMRLTFKNRSIKMN